MQKYLLFVCVLLLTRYAAAQEKQEIIDIKVSSLTDVTLTLNGKVIPPSSFNIDAGKNLNKNADIIFSSYKPGTTFTIGFNYTIDLKK